MYEFGDFSGSLQEICNTAIFVGVVGDDIYDVNAVFAVFRNRAPVEGSPEFRIVVVLVFDNYIQCGCKNIFIIITILTL